MQAIRKKFATDPVMRDLVCMKQWDLKHARSYVYKKGEVERIARDRFERAIKTGDLSEFPNVAYFYSKYTFDRDQLISKQKEVSKEIQKIQEQIGDVDLDGYSRRYNKELHDLQRLRSTLPEKITEIQKKIDVID